MLRSGGGSGSVFEEHRPIAFPNHFPDSMMNSHFSTENIRDNTQPDNLILVRDSLMMGGNG